MKTYELTPKYTSRLSFYGKAVVKQYDDRDELYSRGTLVATVGNGDIKKVVLTDNAFYNATTHMHVKEFLMQHGIMDEEDISYILRRAAYRADQQDTGE